MPTQWREKGRWRSDFYRHDVKASSYPRTSDERRLLLPLPVKSGSSEPNISSKSCACEARASSGTTQQSQDREGTVDHNAGQFPSRRKSWGAQIGARTSARLCAQVPSLFQPSSWEVRDPYERSMISLFFSLRSLAVPKIIRPSEVPLTYCVMAFSISLVAPNVGQLVVHFSLIRNIPCFSIPLFRDAITVGAAPGVVEIVMSSTYAQYSSPPASMPSWLFISSSKSASAMRRAKAKATGASQAT